MRHKIASVLRRWAQKLSHKEQLYLPDYFIRPEIKPIEYDIKEIKVLYTLNRTALYSRECMVSMGIESPEAIKFKEELHLIDKIVEELVKAKVVKFERERDRDTGEYIVSGTLLICTKKDD